MDEAPDRPDPDALLRRLKADEAKARRGKLRIFFGFAPGVGKTYRMLQVARDLVADQKLDVVIGVVETHRRFDTEGLTLGLELLPLRKVEYRGRKLEEFDLDAALSRRPRLLLVDELAHTNAPGSRHAKRWQDVLELLDAGIDVFTTVNVQHVESLNDIVAQITHVQVRETIPDSILDRADIIELVDISPEELLQRLQEGKVYLPEQAIRAADHFFQRGNLLALRELALRRTAQHVDEDVQEYRQEHGVTAAWPASERVCVCIGPSPSSGRLIRAAARLAAGLRCPWVAIYAEGSTLGVLNDADRTRLESHLRLVESLGGTVSRLAGVRIADAILDYARQHGITRILIGKPTHSRLRDRLRGSLLDEVVRGSGDIDVYVVSGEGASTPEPVRAPAPSGSAVHYAAAVSLTALTLGVALALHSLLSLPDPEMLFLLAVMVSAIRFGRGPALLTAALGVACYDFFFVPPYLTFDVSDRRYVLTFAMMFGVGLLLSEMAGRLRRQEREAVTREERTSALYAVSRELASADSAATVAEVVARHAARVFQADALVLRPDENGTLQLLAAVPAEKNLESKEQGVARWAYEHNQLAGLGTDTLPGSETVCAPLSVSAAPVGVLAVAPHQRVPLRSEQREFLEALSRQAAFGLERTRLAEEARLSAVRAKTEEMRSSLLSAVSHDLRTPLAAITGAATSLRDDGQLTNATRGELVVSICEEAERLERLVANLLEMTRLESGAVTLKREWVPLEEIVGSALTRLDGRLAGREVRIRLPKDLPLISVDPVLFEQVLLNVIDNAAKYTPSGSPIEIEARTEGRTLHIEVCDRGPGLPPGPPDQIFDKFFRGPHQGISGVGLGLPICRAIMEIHGGTIRAEPRPGGGATFHLRLTLNSEPPQVTP